MATTKAVSTAIANWDDIDYDPDDMEGVRPSFPEIKLIQKAVANIPNSGSHGGDFWLSDTNEFLHSVDGVILRTQAIRPGIWAKDDFDRPWCSSLDSVHPVPGGKLWTQSEIETRDGVYAVSHDEPKSCHTCVFAQFDGERVPCPLGYLALIELEDGRLYRMRFRGSGAKTMRQFRNMLAGSGVRRGVKKPGRPCFSKKVHIYSEQGSREALVWYYPVIDVVGEVDPAEGPEYAALARALNERFRQTLEATHDEAEDVPPAGEWPDTPPSKVNWNPPI